MKRGEKLFAFLTATILVGSILFEGGMALAISHLEPFTKCMACMPGGGGGGF